MVLIWPTSPLIQLIIAEHHNTPTRRHSGYERTIQRPNKAAYWRGMKKSVRTIVKECDVCQRSKYENTHPARLLQPLPIPNHFWEDMTMDFIEGLPKSGRKSTNLVAIDRLSKFAHFIPLAHPSTAKTVAQYFIE